MITDQGILLCRDAPAPLPVNVLPVIASRSDLAPAWLMAPPSTSAVLFTNLHPMRQW
jgi:hypothetical protein